VAQRIVQSCLESARSRTGIDIVLLRLTAGNHAARALYASLGFRSYGVEPDSMRIDGVSFSTELMALPLGSRAEQPEGRRS
jgi:RimJ/RimL family protein N-acetyltransferase